MLDISARHIVSQLGGTWNVDQNSGTALCPAHNDKNPSLSVTEADGRVLVHCHAGCGQEAVIDALRGQGLWADQQAEAGTRNGEEERDEDEQADKIERVVALLKRCAKAKGTAVEAYLRNRGLDVEVPPSLKFHDGVTGFWPEGPAPVMAARITDHNGRLTGIHMTAIAADGQDKAFGDKPRRIYGTLKGTGAYIRLHRIKGETDAVIAEGIETALAAHQITGLPALSAISASFMKTMAIPTHLRDVIIAADADDPGRESANVLAKRLANEGRRVQIATPPEEGKDWLDMIAEGHDLEDLFQQFAEAPLIAPDASPGLKAVTKDELRVMEFPPRQNILDPWLPEQGLAMIFAPRGVGKTYCALGVAFAVASGDSFLGWTAPREAEVLYLDGELPAALLQERIKDFDRHYGEEEDLPLRFVTPDLQQGAMPDLGTPDGQEAIDQLVGAETRLIIIDSLSTFIRTGDENAAESWIEVQDWALRHRADGRTILFVHHSGKGGQQRGTSKREDVLDTVINLKRPSGYRPEEGAVFEVHFEKARGIYGDDVAPFEAHLSRDENGRMKWVRQSPSDSKINRVVKLLEDGKTQKEIADELGLSEARISQIVKQARERGLLKDTKSKGKKAA